MSKKNRKKKAVGDSKKAIGDSNYGLGEPTWPEIDEVDFCGYGSRIASQLAPANALCSEQLFFLGYPTLSALALRTEMRIACNESVEDIFRNGFRIRSNDPNVDRTDTIAALENEFNRFGIETIMKTIGYNAEAFGSAFLAIRTKNDTYDFSNPLIFGVNFGKGDLLGFRSIEPIWMSPTAYNATNPLADDYYVPSKWAVNGNLGNGVGDGYGIDATRLKQLVLYKVPDYYKPSFLFGGLSLTQMILPYLDNFIKVRNDIPDVVKTFRTQIWETDMQALLQDSSAFKARMQGFVDMRDNFGVMAVDKDREAMTQINTTLTGLKELQDALLELICVPSRLTVTALTGKQTKGAFNNGEEERSTQHEFVASKQKLSYTPFMQWILKVICYHLYGEFYEDLYIDFNPVDELNELEIAEMNKLKVDTYTNLIDAGVLTPEQVHAVIATDEKSEFNGTPFEADELDIEYAEDNQDEDATQSETKPTDSKKLSKDIGKSHSRDDKNND